MPPKGFNPKPKGSKTQAAKRKRSGYSMPNPEKQKKVAVTKKAKALQALHRR